MILSQSAWERILPSHLEPVPQLNEVYELEIAFYESQILSDEELLHNGAYLRGSATDSPVISSCAAANPFGCQSIHRPVSDLSFGRTSSKQVMRPMACFPTEASFHPQMIKGLMNVMGLKTGRDGSRPHDGVLHRSYEPASWDYWLDASARS